MKTLFGIILLAMIIGCGFAQAEPAYLGKPESYWINLLTNLDTRLTVMEWRKLGTNEMPILLKAVKIKGVPNASSIRFNAARMLSNRTDAKTLLEIERRAPDSDVKRLILESLTFNADKSVTVAMVEALQDKDPKIRRAAVFGLGLGVRQMIPEELSALVKCLQDPDPDVRFNAAIDLCSHSLSGYTNITQHEVAEAALIEIQKAGNSTNSDISQAAIKALKEQYPEFTLSTYAHELALLANIADGTNWTATLKVVDESNKTIGEASASIGYYVPDIQRDGEMRSGWEEVKGTTDSNGVFIVSHKGSSPAGFSASKEGYYSSSGSHEAILFKDNDPEKWNPTITLALKKKIHPIPMYARGARVQIPGVGKAIGFDLVKSDWVAPYGKGKQSDIIFETHRRWASRRDFDSTLKVTFSNAGDGLLVAPVAPGNGSRVPVTAPVDGYTSGLQRELSNTSVGRKDDSHKDQNYYLRVRTVLDANGKVQSALYGKIYGDFTLDPINSKTTWILFTYYLNPTPNDRNVEFDPQRNLLGGLPSYEQVKAP